MGLVAKQVYCTFPKDRIREPILYNLGQNFQVIPNIRGASIDDDIGLVCLEIEGDEEEVTRAIEYLVDRDVQVETRAPDRSPGANPG